SHNARVRWRFKALTAFIALASLLVLLHEVAVWHSDPEPPIHVALHVGLVLVALMLIAGIPVLWNSCHILNDYQKSLHLAYDDLEGVVDHRTKALAESQALFESLFNAVQDRMVVVDRKGKVVKANRAAADWAARDPTGKPFDEVFPDSSRAKDRRRELALIHHTFRAGAPCRGRLIRSGGTGDQILSVDIYPVPDASGEPRMVIQVARDVTSQKEAELQSQHQEKMAALGMLAAGFAHDLGNPLASLSSELQLLEEESDLARIRESFGVLNQHVDRITRGLREMVDFARRRGEQGVEVPLERATADALRLVTHDPRAKDVTIETEFADPLPSVRMKEDDIVLVLVNLLLNAFDAMSSKGVVRISGAPTEPGSVRLTIADSGAGMDAQVLSAAARPLFTTKSPSGGSGLGLAVANAIMRRAGGALELYSMPGQGTRVTLTFPAAVAR
ncbi:MAG: ATP-binding protein, partial [Gammaproteobacteria bacterium]